LAACFISEARDRWRPPRAVQSVACHPRLYGNSPAAFMILAKGRSKRMLLIDSDGDGEARACPVDRGEGSRPW